MLHCAGIYCINVFVVIGIDVDSQTTPLKSLRLKIKKSPSLIFAAELGAFKSF